MQLRGIVCILMAIVALNGCSAPSQSVAKLGVFDLQSQRISGVESVRISGAPAFFSASVLVTVGVDGQVIDAAIDDEHFEGDASAVLTAAKGWKFRPQFYRGRPIQAVGSIPIELDPLEIPPDSSIAFPDSALADIEITLERGSCFGPCPDYKVTITGDGKVRFSMRNFSGLVAEVHKQFNGRNVLWPGTHDARVSVEAVAALVEKFRATHFIGMKPEYVAEVTDNPSYALTLRVGKTTKRVVDYVGKKAGMPASVKTLEDSVDELAATDRWVRGNAETVNLLKTQKFNFRSREAAELVKSAIQLNGRLPGSNGVADLILAALKEGLDLTSPVESDAREKSNGLETIGSVIASYAIEAGNEALFNELIRRGQIARMTKKELNSGFLSEMGCNASMAKALVAAGANPTTVGDSGTALHTIGDSFRHCAQAGSAKRVEIVRTLIALGVPVNARDVDGQTALMYLNDPAASQLLLDAGADPNAKDNDGRPVLMTLDDDRAVLTLLRAGADAKVKDGDGTLRQQAGKRHWPGTLTWLDDHNVP